MRAAPQAKIAEVARMVILSRINQFFDLTKGRNYISTQGQIGVYLHPQPEYQNISVGFIPVKSLLARYKNPSMGAPKHDTQRSQAGKAVCDLFG